MNAGESASTIADEMTAALNEANKQYQAEQEAAKRAAQEAERVKLVAETKRQDMAEILLNIADFLQKYYPDMCREAVGKMSKEDKDELFDLILDVTLEALEDTANPKKKKMFNFGMDPMTMMLMQSMMGKTPNFEKQSKSKSDDDILNDFLGSICH